MELASEIAELLAVHKGIEKTKEHEGEVVLSGILFFEAEPNGLVPITGSFGIEMLIPEIYPDDLPKIRETGGRIDGNYHHVFTNGTLCLGVPVEMRRLFAQEPSLLGFVNKLVVPYLYGYCYWKKYGEHPFGEQKHNGEGIIQYYIEKMNLNDEVSALSCICFLYEYGYQGHYECPCGSGCKARKCHGQVLHDLHQHHTSHTLYHDLVFALKHCFTQHANGKLQFPNKLTNQIHRIFESNGRKLF